MIALLKVYSNTTVIGYDENGEVVLNTNLLENAVKEFDISENTMIQCPLASEPVKAGMWFDGIEKKIPAN